MIDTNKVIKKYLDDGIGGVIPRIYCPRLPEKAVLPAITFFTRGGSALPIQDGIVSPSIQFDCWADDPIEARLIYGVLFDYLQGTGGDYATFVAVTLGANTYYILEANEESQGMDIRDLEMPNYCLVRTFFTIKIKL